MSIDPHCEKYYWITPYAYCLDNPLKLIDPSGKDPALFGVNPKKKNHFGMMPVLPTNYKSDPKKALQADFDNARKNNIPVMTEDNAKDFAAGMQMLKDEKVTVNAYSISQHGSSGNAKIGEEPVSATTDFTPLKEGLSGKNVMFSQCNIVQDDNKEGIATLKYFSAETNSNAVAAEQRVPAGHVEGSQNSVTGNGFILVSPTKTNGQPQEMYNFEIKPNGTFVWTNNDVDTSK